MKFINTDGMAFIGPGSEWFWTAMSGIVLAVTFIAIYRQLRLARSASAREQLDTLDRDWNSERFARCGLEVLTALRDGADPASVPGAAAETIILYWERVGALARGGHLDPKLLYSYNGGVCAVYWVALAPYIRRARAAHNDPTECSMFEWLAGVMVDLDRRGGAGVYNDASLASELHERIAILKDRLRFEQALRSAMVAQSDPVAIEQPVPPQPPLVAPVKPATAS